jgi:hypothetical protein
MQGKQAKILSPTQERAILGYLVTTRYGVPVVLERLWEAFHNRSRTKPLADSLVKKPLSTDILSRRLSRHPTLPRSQ